MVSDSGDEQQQQLLLPGAHDPLTVMNRGAEAEEQGREEGRERRGEGRDNMQEHRFKGNKERKNSRGRTKVNEKKARKPQPKNDKNNGTSNKSNRNRRDSSSSSSSSSESDALASNTERLHDPTSNGPLWRLYLSHTMTAWTMRMWEFAVALMLISIKPDSLILPSIYEFALCISVMTINPTMGRLVDTRARLPTARWSLTLTKIPFSVSAFFVYILLSGRVSEDKSESGFYATIALIIFLTTCGHVSYNCNKLSVEKDWVKAICAGDDQLLARANATLRRIDLTCKLLSPMAAGFIMTYGGRATGAIVISIWNAASLMPEMFLLSNVYKAFPVLAAKQRVAEGDSSLDPLQTFRALASGWKSYSNRTVFRPGLGLAMLYSSVLSMSSITVAYCFYRGLSEALLGVLRGVGAVFGIGATFLFPTMHSRLGLVRSGLYSIWGLVACLLLCLVGVVLAHSADGDCSGITDDDHKSTCESNRIQEMAMLMTGMITARMGLWLYDLTVTQVFQEWVDDAELGVINGVQVSLQMFFSLVPPVAGIIFSSPTDFDILAIGSFACVSAAALVYTSFFAIMRDSGFLDTTPPIHVVSSSNSRHGGSSGAGSGDGGEAANETRKMEAADVDDGAAARGGGGSANDDDDDDAMLDLSLEGAQGMNAPLLKS